MNCLLSKAMKCPLSFLRDCCFVVLHLAQILAMSNYSHVTQITSQTVLFLKIVTAVLHIQDYFVRPLHAMQATKISSPRKAPAKSVPRR